MKDAKAKGLVRAIGLSTHHVDIAMAASKMEDLDEEAKDVVEMQGFEVE